MRLSCNKGLRLLGSGLSGEPNCTITVDCSGLLSDVAARLSAGETLAEMMPDLHYGVLAELEECLGILLAQLQQTIGGPMNNPIGNNNSPEPTIIMPPFPSGAFFLF